MNRRVFLALTAGAAIAPKGLLGASPQTHFVSEVSQHGTLARIKATESAYHEWWNQDCPFKYGPVRGISGVGRTIRTLKAHYPNLTAFSVENLATGAGVWWDLRIPGSHGWWI